MIFIILALLIILLRVLYVKLLEEDPVTYNFSIAMMDLCIGIFSLILIGSVIFSTIFSISENIRIRKLITFNKIDYAKQCIIEDKILIDETHLFWFPFIKINDFEKSIEEIK